MRHLHFVVNPEAGRGRALKAWHNIVDEIRKQADLLCESVYMTHSYSGEGFTWHAEGPVSERVLVCVGGDGSVHYNAKLAFSMGVPLGIVPGGTGNDYAANLGLPHDIEGVAQTLLRGTPTPVDALTVNGQFVANLAGFGIDAEVVQWVAGHQGAKKVGKAAYAIAVPVVLSRHKSFPTILRLPEGDELRLPDVSILAIANGERFGGGMKIAPNANPQDATLDLVVASGLSKLGLLRLFPKIYSGAHITDVHVTRFCATSLEIEFPGRIPSAEYDGEPYNTGKTLSVELSRGLRVLMPTPKTIQSAP